MRILLKRKSIMTKLTLFLTAALVLQSCLFAAFVLFGGTMGRLDENAMDILTKQTINRKNDLENSMVQRWSNLRATQNDVQTLIRSFLEVRGLSAADLTPQNDDTTELMAEFYVPLVEMMRRNGVTGAFVILHGGDPLSLPPEGVSQYKAGLYLRDMDPDSTPSDDSDLLVERGPSQLLRRLDLTMDTIWTPTFQVSRKDDTYFNPLLAALEYPGVDPADLAYWSPPLTLDGDNVGIITYSQPLFDAGGVPCGVLGVELDLDYLRRQLPYTELGPERMGTYLLAIRQPDSNGTLDLRPVVTSGPTAKHIFGESPEFFRFRSQPVYGDIYHVDSGACRVKDGAYGSVQPLNLYNSNTPFEDQQWVLVGLAEGSDLFSFSRSLAVGLMALVAALLVFGALLSAGAGFLFTRPIRTLARKVQGLDPNQPIHLEPTNVSEIDELSASIERLSRDVASASSRLTQIIGMAQIPLAAFELSDELPKAYYTKDFFPLMGLPEPSETLSAQEFTRALKGLDRYVDRREPDGTLLYKFPSGHGGSRWLRLQVVSADSSILGVLVDVTRETLEKRRIEYERDYDLLTSLLNRRAFQSQMARLEADPGAMKIGAMLMMDLDNLKYVNDTYGHDSGDQYIRCAAGVLRTFNADRGVAARISGDEFRLFFSGYDNRESLLAVIDLLQERIAAAHIRLPDGQPYRLRASVGIAWYPDDSTSLAELARFADFAMYEAKNAVKGSIRYFDVRTYQRDSYLLYSREELNRILDEQAVDYAFQPIVACATGEIMGYEALMRPRSKALPTPLEVLRIARSQSKLTQLERLTWFRAMESFVALPDKGDESLVFINTIPSLSLSSQELAQFDQRFGPYLHRICMELTESDEFNPEATLEKKRRSQEWHFRIALDDYGTGYSNDAVLLNVKPDFVKVDMSIIRGIDQDRNRQTLFRNLASFCRELGAEVIAEGVETEAELRAVVALGTDYIQGYFLSKPALQPLLPPPGALAVMREAYEKRT